MKRTHKILIVSTILALALAVISLVDARGLRRLRRLRAEITAYEGRNQALTRQNAALLREVQALSGNGDNKALERAAREDLGLVKPNEIIFNFEQ